MAESKKAKPTGRRGKQESLTPGLHAVPKEVVEIERNLIENWLISLKHWFQNNIETARKIILGIMAAGLLVLIGVFIYGAMIDKQNSTFYSLMISYGNLKKNPAINNNQNDKIKELRDKADSLCKTMISTDYSNSGCLLSALFSNELKEYEAAAQTLQKFSKKSGNDAFSSYSALVSGLLFEKTGKQEEAIGLYKNLLDNLDENTNRDIALYHYARLLYHQKNYKEAGKYFQEIMDNHKNSMFLNKAKQYILLMGIKNN